MNNELLLAEVVKCLPSKVMSNELAKMLMEIVQRYSRKASFKGFTYLDDMACHALTVLTRTWHHFDPNKSNRPYEFYIQTTNGAFVNYLAVEKKEARIVEQIRDLNPLDTEQEGEENA